MRRRHRDRRDTAATRHSGYLSDLDTGTVVTNGEDRIEAQKQEQAADITMAGWMVRIDMHEQSANMQHYAVDFFLLTFDTAVRRTCRNG